MVRHFIAFRERYIVGSAVVGLLTPLTALAQGSVGRPSGIPQQFRDFPSTIRNIFNIVITGAGIIFVVLFLIGGVQYLTAAGNEDTTKKARQLMIDAVIGLGIVVTSWAIGTYILSLLGIQGAAGGNLPTAPTTIQ